MKKLSLIHVLESDHFEPMENYEDEGDDAAIDNPRQNLIDIAYRSEEPGAEGAADRRLAKKKWVTRINKDPSVEGPGNQAFSAPSGKTRDKGWKYSQVPVTPKDPNQKAIDSFSQEMEQDSPVAGKTGPLRPEPQMQPRMDKEVQHASPWVNNSIKQIYEPRLQQTKSDPFATQIPAPKKQKR